MFIGNTFPLTLVRRPVKIEPISEIYAKNLIKHERELISFWGHENTINIASRYAGVDLTPEKPRPALSLTGDGYPELFGHVSKRVLVLSPEYPDGFRPAIGVEVEANQILGWVWLLVEFI